MSNQPPGRRRSRSGPGIDQGPGETGTPPKLSGPSARVGHRTAIGRRQNAPTLITPSRSCASLTGRFSLVSNDSFVHLHVHTEYSMLDGAAKIAPMFAEAKRLEMPAVGMTDHGNMYGRTSSTTRPQGRYQADHRHRGLRRAGVPLQQEARCCGATPRSQKGDDVSGSGAYTHMTMLAQNATGAAQPVQAVLAGLHRGPARQVAPDGRGDHRRAPRRHHRHHRLPVRRGADPAAAGPATTRRSGRREVPGDLRPRQLLPRADGPRPVHRAAVREGLLDIGRKLGIPPLATNDCHYVTKDQADTHEALLCIQSGKTLNDPTRFKFDGDGYYLKSAAEMREIWDNEVPGASDSTLLIAERVSPTKTSIRTRTGCRSSRCRRATTGELAAAQGDGGAQVALPRRDSRRVHRAV